MKIALLALFLLAACNDKSKPVEVPPTPETTQAAAATETGLAAAQTAPTTDQAPASCGCGKIFNPVCGSDGVTYGNACEAECQKVTYTEGDCNKPN